MNNRELNFRPETDIDDRERKSNEANRIFLVFNVKKFWEIRTILCETNRPGNVLDRRPERFTPTDDSRSPLSPGV